jgi:hypothetical protein
LLLLRECYMHPSGQLPAYEWAFGDVNPPVHAWTALRVFENDGSCPRSSGPVYWIHAEASDARRSEGCILMTLASAWAVALQGGDGVLMEIDPGLPDVQAFQHST